MNTRLEQARFLVADTRALYHDALAAEYAAKNRLEKASQTRAKTERLLSQAKDALALIERQS